MDFAISAFYCVYFLTPDKTWASQEATTLLSLSVAVVSEWLRSQTRNLMGYARTGSNPVACETFLETGLIWHRYALSQQLKLKILMLTPLI